MPYDRPTIRRLLSRVMGDVESRLRNGASYIAGTLENAAAFALGGLAHTMHGHVEWGVRQIFVQTADEDSLRTKAGDYGLDLTPAEAAEFQITVTGNSEGYTIPSGTRWTRADGVVFASSEDYDTPADPFQVTVTVEAVEPGAAGNTIPGAELTIETPNANLQTVATVQGAGSTPVGGGADQEDIEAFRQRFLDRLGNPPRGGGPGDYRAWALESSSAVTRAWELPNQLGPQTVVVLFVNDLFDENGVYSSTQFPGASEVQEVQDYIDGLAPTTVTTTVVAPTETPLNFEIEISPNTTEVQNQVTELLRDLMLRQAEPNGTLRRSAMREAISLAPGENFHNLTTPAADVVASSSELLVLGTITFSEAAS